MRKLPILFVLFSVATRAQSPSTVRIDSLFSNQQWSAAIPLYEIAVKSGVNNAITWNRLGFCYHNVGQIDLAIKNYLISLNNNPTPSLEQVVQARLSRAYSINNEIEKSFAALDRALALGYVNVTELESHGDFTNLRKDKRFDHVKELAIENAFPCKKNAQAREFDFWVGEWDVYNRGTTTLVGKSKIESASGGCMVLENWTAVGNPPHNGKSMNFVDPESGKWMQVWVGSSGINNLNITRFYDGEYKDGAMRFLFDRWVQGQKIIGRFIFYNEGPNQVRQFNEQSTDSGKTWTTSYDFTYKRIGK
jgi:tetratricopeptide (TPR) repeat protein